MRITYNIHTIWIILILLTLMTYSLSFIEVSGATVMMVLMTAAFTKGVLIIREFMELKGVSLLWKLIIYGWLTIVCLVIVMAYLIA